MINKLYNEKRKTQKALNNLKELQKELELKNEELEKISITDKLTNIYNRHKIDEVLKYELLRCARTKQSFGLIIVDVDYFKSVNDEFGHNVGDNVLVSIVDVIRNNIRQTDILGRWGGEEFVIIVTETTKEDIVYFSQKLRKIIESTPIEDIGFKTCSFGVTISKNGDNSNKIIERADSALYLAKQKGRNKVEFID
jgi:polar amino acid transport system substrate-binding protein